MSRWRIVCSAAINFFIAASARRTLLACPRYLAFTPFMLVIVGTAHPTAALAVNAETCIEDGGTAICTGPEVSQYSWNAGSYPTWYVNGNGAVGSEQEGITGMLNIAYNTFHACTASIEIPPWISTTGLVGYGNRAVGIPGSVQQTTGDYVQQWWLLGIEYKQGKSTVRIKGTSSTTAVPPCSQQLYSGALGLWRERLVSCPVGYVSNSLSAPIWDYCVRPAPASYDPPKNLGPCKDCDLSAGNPINIATGNKYQEERDYIGTGRFPLEYVRRYNSLAYGSIYYGPRYFSAQAMWRGTYDRAVLFSDHPRFPVARVHRQDGSVLQFRWNGSLWVPQSDVIERLTRLVDGSGNPAGWTLTTKNDELETYDIEGRLTLIRDRAGVLQSLTYDTSGRLLSVSHSFGQQLSFAYDSSNRVASVTTPTGVIQYAYGGPSNLISATYPDSSGRTYHYENASFPRALTGITDESSVRFATVAYDGTGKASLTKHGTSMDQFSVVYSTSMRSTVTDPLGTSRTFDFSSVQSTPHATAISAPCSTCASGAQSKTFDANGNVASRTDFNGNVTTYSFDVRNLETARTEASGTPSARTITTQWNSTYRLPTLITEPGKTTAFTHDANGNVLTRAVTDTATSTARTWTYTYNSFGQVLTAAVEGNRGRRHCCCYNEPQLRQQWQPDRYQCAAEPQHDASL